MKFFGIAGNDPEMVAELDRIARQHKQSILSRDTHFDPVPGIARNGW